VDCDVNRRGIPTPIGELTMADLEENARRKAAGKREIALSPIAIEIVRRIDALFAIERSINGQSADHRKAVRQAQSAPLVADLEAYMREQCAKLSRGHDLAKAMNYVFKRWGSFTRFLDDGRVCLSNNAAERALRGIALGRKSWLFCGPDRGGRRAAAMYGLIVSAKMNDVDPQAWLADVLARIAAHPTHRLDELLPWNWKTVHQQGLAMQAACWGTSTKSATYLPSAMSPRCLEKTRNGCLTSPTKWTPRMANYGSSASVKTA
jgi:transposase